VRGLEDAFIALTSDDAGDAGDTGQSVTNMGASR